MTQMHLVSDYSFENIQNEIITLQKGVVFTLIESGAYTPATNSNVLWKCGAGKQDFTILSIPKVFLREFNEEGQRRQMAKNLQK
jgi:hypothetical protein